MWGVAFAPLSRTSAPRLTTTQNQHTATTNATARGKMRSHSNTTSVLYNPTVTPDPNPQPSSITPITPIYDPNNPNRNHRQKPCNINPVTDKPCNLHALLKLLPYGDIQICLLICRPATYHNYYYLTSVPSSQGMKKIRHAIQKVSKNQAGMNLTPPPPSQNGRVVKCHCLLLLLLA